MQPVAAQHLLSTLPAAGTVLDPFCGSGTTLVEALRSGRAAVGADASPLALFVSAHQTWRPAEDDLSRLRDAATAVMKAAAATASEHPPPSSNTRPARSKGGRGPRRPSRKAWVPLRDAIGAIAPGVDAAEEVCPLWFCFSAALQRAERSRNGHKQQLPREPLECFDATVDEYIASLRSLTVSAASAAALALVVGAVWW